MTNLDVFCQVLSRVTSRPESYFRRNICMGIESGKMPAGNLFDECPDGTALIERLVAHEAPGILNWLVEGPRWRRGMNGKPCPTVRRLRMAKRLCTNARDSEARTMAERVISDWWPGTSCGTFAKEPPPKRLRQRIR